MIGSWCVQQSTDELHRVKENILITRCVVDVDSGSPVMANTNETQTEEEATYYEDWTPKNRPPVPI